MYISLLTSSPQMEWPVRAWHLVRACHCYLYTHMVIFTHSQTITMIVIFLIAEYSKWQFHKWKNLVHVPRVCMTLIITSTMHCNFFYQESLFKLARSETTSTIHVPFWNGEVHPLPPGPPANLLCQECLPLSNTYLLKRYICRHL